MYEETSIHEISPRHQLAVAYSLRALCTQEYEPQSEVLMHKLVSWIDYLMLKCFVSHLFAFIWPDLTTLSNSLNGFCYKQKVFQDIRAALDIWLGISTADKCFPDDKSFMVSENTMMLLYNIIDLLSIKVCLFYR